MDDVVRTAWAGAVSNGDFVCVETYSGYRSSQSDPKGKQYLLSPDVSDQELGAAVLDALAHSRFVTPQEDLDLFECDSLVLRYKEWVQSVMKKYRYKSKRAMFKNMKNCSIEKREGIIEISPWHHE